MTTTQREIVYLTCDEQEFRQWLTDSYPDLLSYNQQRTGIFSLRLNLFTAIQIGYALELGKYKYIFDLKQPNGPSIEFDLFLSAIRNKFSISQVINESKQLNLSFVDGVCLRWVNRDKSPRIEMAEFLQDIYEKDGKFITKKEFHNALKDACRRGIIDKPGKYFVPKLVTQR
jgi:hypothetical protein